MKLRSRLLLLLLAAVALLGASAFALQPGTASAHPLGNFTINHFTRIEVSPDGLTVYRVLDMAEIPALQERQRIDTDGDGAVSDAETQAWARAKTGELAAAMTVTVDGKRAQLTPVTSTVTYPEGQGGLVLVRLVATYTADIPDGWRDKAPQIAYEDDAYADRLGWREVVVRGAPGIAVIASDLPESGVSDELRSYPENQLQSPLDVRSATFSFGPGTGSAPEPPSTAQQDLATRGNPDAALGGFTDLIAEKELSVGFVVVALLTATAFGAIHALSPGHGKTVVAAYLVGSRGTLRHAALLGLVVTVTHTSSVYLLGFVTLYLSEFIVPEDLYPWMGIISGAIIVLMGLSLFIGRMRATGLPARALAYIRRAGRRRPSVTLSSESGAIVLPSWHQPDAKEHSHSDAEHDHHHVHDDDHRDERGDEPHHHGWGPAHSHAIPGHDGEPVTWQRLVGLGIFGGMIPCPSAIVVMLSAIALHRVGFGLVLILAFSTGLAVVLTCIGFAVVYAERIPLLKHAMDRTESSGGPTRFMVRAVPVFAAVLVTAAGVVITTRAAGQF